MFVWEMRLDIFPSSFKVGKIAVYWCGRSTYGEGVIKMELIFVLIGLLAAIGIYVVAKALTQFFNGGSGGLSSTFVILVGTCSQRRGENKYLTVVSKK